jgi:hypothetical protein
MRAFPLAIGHSHFPRAKRAQPLALRRSGATSSCMSRTLIIIGLIVVAIGLLWPWLSKLGLGRLPGDIVVRRENFAFYFPIVTSLILSVIASLLFWLFRR